MQRPVLLSALALASLLACGDSDDPGATGAPSGSGGTGAATGTSSGGATSGGTGGAGAQGAGGEGATGANGGGNAGGAGGAPIRGSEGCGRPTTDPSEEWVAKTTTVGGVIREYFVYLPADYDPSTPYPVVYQFHGCSGSVDKQNNNPPVQNESGPDAIHVRGRAVGTCWEVEAGSDDVDFFDELVSVMEASYCADVDRRFATGYSSGAFMTHRLACDRGDMLRGVASIAGGLAGTNCAGRTAALLIHDANDNTVPITASESARDRHLDNNGCATPPETSAVSPEPCEEYAGCDTGYPVVWCRTTGQDHSRQDALSAPAFWDFLNAL